ncbi:MAG: hypothetical protein AAGD35_20290 [Actinomycetota bacterium]
MSSCVCGCESTADAHFCRNCGRQLAGGGGDGDDLLELTPESIETAGTVVKGNTGGRFVAGVGLVLIAVVVAAAAWVTVGVSAAPDDEADADAGETPADPTGEASSGPADDTTGDETTGEETVEADPGGERTELGVGAFEAGDYDLVVAVGDELVVLDLDDGVTATAYRNPGLEPVATVGDWLLVSRNNRLLKLALDGLGGTPEPLVDGAEGFQEVVDVGEGAVWLYDVDFGAAESTRNERLLQVDLETGAVIDSPLVDVIDITALWTGTADLGPGQPLMSRAGGVYEFADGSFRKVLDGRLTSADGDRALVETCDDLLRCRQTWYDRTTWAPLQVGTFYGDGQRSVLLAGTDWLWTFDLTERTAMSIVNIETGRRVTIEDGIDDLSFGVGPAVSPDGRWLATVRPDESVVALRNLANDNVVELPFEGAASGAAVFIDRS